MRRVWLGLIMDGLGYGEDGGLWGGELLRWRDGRCERLSHAAPLRLLGGEKAQRTPWRVLLSLLWQHLGPERVADDADLHARFASQPLPMLRQAWEKGLNAPETTSLARWFDVLAAMTGLWWDEMSYEGQAAMLTESAFDPECSAQAPFGFTEAGHLTLAPFLRWWLDHRHEPASHVVTAFYRGLAATLSAWVARHLQEETAGVVVSGGVAQNLTLMALLARAWPRHFPPLLLAEKVPANDQGVAVGQALSGRQGGLCPRGLN